MNKTIQISIGLVITVIFFGMAFYKIPAMMYGPDENKTTDLLATVSGTDLIVTFMTTEEMQATVHYSVGGVVDLNRLTKYNTAHRADIDVSAYGGQTMDIYIDACDVMGECERSETISVVI